MSKPLSNTIRRQFIDFFKERGHRAVPGWPLAPPDDPTLLFTNAGMNQFKDVFLGTGTRDYTRAVDHQKCLRVSGKHNDLEAVGRDTYHHTFFEMLGNWSFGDYFKKEAIEWAWDLLTRVWGLPASKMYATVYLDDDEAEKLWLAIPGMDPARVLRFGDKDNFWEMGETGPCGPCSEIHFDRGEGTCDQGHLTGHRCGVNAGCARFIELWNLVFIQYERRPDRSLHKLPARHVDTGAGFDRIVAVLGGETDNYKTDLFGPVMARIEELSGRPYTSAIEGMPHRVMADHLRALTFAIGDGILPSNDGRGYVLRRILRRAARYSRKLDLHEPVLHRLVGDLVGVMAEAYPEALERRSVIERVILAEEESFGRTLDRGLEIFEETTARLLARGERVVPAADVFVLYDRFGFPADLTVLMAEEKGMKADAAGFEAEMDRKREDTRSASGRPALSSDAVTASDASPTLFLGYETHAANARMQSIQESNGVWVVRLDRTPFYAEAGGQVGDRGTITAPGFRMEVEDARREGDRILHFGKIVEGVSRPPEPGTEVEAQVDGERRLDTARNHTATHLLQAALRSVLGDHVQQQSSLVTPDLLRFDFSHFGRVTDAELFEVERLVNKRVRFDLPVTTRTMDLQEARRSGALAFFGDKYKDDVRVVEIADVSRELCGGTHLRATGEIGLFRIVAEGASAAGVRRIMALTGRGAEEHAHNESLSLRAVRDLLQSPPGEEASRLEKLLQETKSLRKESAVQEQTAHENLVAAIGDQAVSVDGVRVAAGRLEASDLEALKTAADALRDRLGSGVGVLGAAVEGKVLLVCVVTADLIKERGLKAGDVVSRAAALVGGGGGGKPHMATAGGKDPARLDEALRCVPDIVSQILSKKR